MEYKPQMDLRTEKVIDQIADEIGIELSLKKEK